MLTNSAAQVYVIQRAYHSDDKPEEEAGRKSGSRRAWDIFGQLPALGLQCVPRPSCPLHCQLKCQLVWSNQTVHATGL